MTSPGLAGIAAATGKPPVAIITTENVIVIPDGDPFQEVRCLLCNGPLGDEPVSFITVAVLDGSECPCPRLVSDTFALHAAHEPADETVLQASVKRVLSDACCDG